MIIFQKVKLKKNKKKNILIGLKNMFSGYKGVNLVVLLLLLFVFFDFTKLLKVNYDHLLFDNNTFLRNIQHAYAFTVKGQARPSFISPITTGIEYLNSDYYWVWTIIYVFLIGLGGSLIIKEITKRKSLMYLTFVLIVTYSVISLEPISIPSAYALVLGFGVYTLLFSVYFALKYNNTNLYKYKILATSCFLLSSFTYEVGILYLPVLIGINCIYLKKFSIKENWKKSKEFVVAGLFYVVVYMLVKVAYGGGNYNGTQINTFDIGTIINTFGKVFIATIPGFFFFYDKSAAYFSPIHDLFIDSKTLSFDYILNKYLNFRLILSTLLFIYVIHKLHQFYLIESENRVFSKTKNMLFERYIPVFLGIVSVVFPIIPYILTQNTQQQIVDRWRLAGICNQYSFVFLIIGIVMLLYYFGAKFLRDKRVFILYSVILTVLFMLTSVTNKNNAQIINTLGMRFKQFDIIIDNISGSVGDGGIIFTDSLKATYGLMSIPDSYFSNRFVFKTNRKIKMTSTINDIMGKETVYFLRYMYTDNFNNTLFILSKQKPQEIVDFYKNEENGNISDLFSKDIKIFSFSKIKNYDIVGLKIAKNNIYNYKYFSYPINQVVVNQNKPSVVSFANDEIDVASIHALPQYKSTVQKIEKINIP